MTDYSYICNPNQWGISSAGRALAWHARGQEFESPMLHKKGLQSICEPFF